MHKDTCYADTIKWTQAIHVHRGKQTMSESNFETAEVGDWFKRDRGIADHYKVIEIEETFGDRVRVVLETRSISAQNDDTHTVRADESTLNNEFEPVDKEEH